jgi:hypothetical protein
MPAHIIVLGPSHDALVRAGSSHKTFTTLFTVKARTFLTSFLKVAKTPPALLKIILSDIADRDPVFPKNFRSNKSPHTQHLKKVPFLIHQKGDSHLKNAGLFLSFTLVSLRLNIFVVTVFPLSPAYLQRLFPWS